MKALGLDLGNKTLGVAISDDLGFLARPLKTIRFEDKDFEHAKTQLLTILEEEQITQIVLGLPKNMDGSTGEQGELALQFKTLLEKEMDIPILMWDERLTSKMASNMMKQQNLSKSKRREVIDAMAAVVILQGYLDRQS